MFPSVCSHTPRRGSSTSPPLWRHPLPFCDVIVVGRGDDGNEDGGNLGLPEHEGALRNGRSAGHNVIDQEDAFTGKVGGVTAEIKCSPDIASSLLGIQLGLRRRGTDPAKSPRGPASAGPGEIARHEFGLVEAAAERSRPVERNGHDHINQIMPRGKSQPLGQQTGEHVADLLAVLILALEDESAQRIIVRADADRGLETQAVRATAGAARLVKRVRPGRATATRARRRGDQVGEGLAARLAQRHAAVGRRGRRARRTVGRQEQLLGACPEFAKHGAIIDFKFQVPSFKLEV